MLNYKFLFVVPNLSECLPFLSWVANSHSTDLIEAIFLNIFNIQS